MKSGKNTRECFVETKIGLIAVEMFRMKTLTEGLSGIGYDALFAILEIKTFGGKVFWFYDVPEYIWYEWRSVENPTAFFNKHIVGKFEVIRVE